MKTSGEISEYPYTLYIIPYSYHSLRRGLMRGFASFEDNLCRDGPTVRFKQHDTGIDCNSGSPLFNHTRYSRDATFFYKGY